MVEMTYLLLMAMTLLSLALWEILPIAFPDDDNIY
jgi:hypothetical protein